VRPSALLSVLQTAGVAAGAAAALAPRATRDAAIAALQESLTDLNNDNLRLLREAGLSDEVRDTLGQCGALAVRCELNRRKLQLACLSQMRVACTCTLCTLLGSSGGPTSHLWERV